ncbi:hypothetical protein PVK06_010707 [Gossypium arboreum]|uniref:Uncharacterized protein n=1 Tax=Gossypium arboreum TaxID=29729 RepID=A0ABR0Q7J3_GOSAR|nr:hypothetical protein PVK06_010707 [Gossypium arboreum]
MEEVEHDIPELEDEGYSTVIEHDELNICVQQEFRVEERDKIVRSEKGFFTLIYVGLVVGVVLDVEGELKPESSKSVEEPTHFLTMVEEELTDQLNENTYFQFEIRIEV